MRKSYLVWDTWNMKENEAETIDTYDMEYAAEKFAEICYWQNNTFKKIQVSIREKGSSDVHMFNVEVERDPVFRAHEVKETSAEK